MVISKENNIIYIEHYLFNIMSVGSSVIALCLNHSPGALNQHVSVTNIKSSLVKEQ